MLPAAPAPTGAAGTAHGGRSAVDLNRVPNAIAAAMLLLAALVVLGNGFNLYRDRRNRRRGIPEHLSMVPLVAPIFRGIAGFQRL